MPSTSHPGARLSPRRRPDDMAPADWQRQFRKQFGLEQAFTLRAPMKAKWVHEALEAFQDRN